MASGLYPDAFVVERFLASVSATTITQPWPVPFDCDVVGMMLVVGTAPGATHAVSVNVSNSPTSQISVVSAYNLWTTANVPTITGTATFNFTTTLDTTFYGSQSLVKNVPYSLNYPLPGPSGTTGFITAQSTSTGTSTPVTSPPTLTIPELTALVVPDNTYTDINSVTLVPASHLHAGDIASFVVSGSSLGSAANLEMELILLKS
jgi:hypothetical protein